MPPSTTFRPSIIAMILAAIATGVAVFNGRPLVAFFLTLGLVTLSTLVIGLAITGYWFGVLIDDRNRISLSRMQMVLWTIVLLSGFTVGALSNVARNTPNPLAIAVPQELWMLMGISVTSLVGTPLLLNQKRSEPSPSNATAVTSRAAEFKTTQENMAKQNAPEGSVAAFGTLVGWTEPGYSRLSDLFRGEEIPNAPQVDLAKIQMFFFTVVLVFAYVVALASTFAQTQDAITAMPVLDQGMIALLTISHAGYLTSKVVPRPPTE